MNVASGEYVGLIARGDQTGATEANKDDGAKRALPA